MAGITSVIRNAEAPELLLQFLVCAPTTVLGIRFYLHLTGYPQIGRGGLHIAHMLWGGALLLLSIVILLGFLSRGAQRWGAIIGGIGFGAFIDELGKFVTRDNNYFFEPSVALIYVIFVLLGIVWHAFSSGSPLSPAEHQINALRVIEDALAYGLTLDRGARLRRHLDHADGQDPAWHAMLELARSLHVAAPEPETFGDRLQEWLRARYAEVAHRPAFQTALVVAFAAHALSMIGNAVARSGLLVGDIPAALSFSHSGELLTAVASGCCALIGMLRLRRSRLDAYRWFKSSVLIALLTTEFFVFLAVQFFAVPGFVFNLCVLLVVSNLIRQERAEHTRSGSGADRAVPTPEQSGLPSLSP